MVTLAIDKACKFMDTIYSTTELPTFQSRSLHPPLCYLGWDRVGGD